MSILLVEKGPQGLEAAVMHCGKLYAYAGPASPDLREGQVFLGVVDRAMPALSAVFIRLTGGQQGFLPVSKGQKAPPSGSRVIVQVRRPPNGQKKAMLTRDVALAGEFAVYLPCGHGAHVSSRVTDENEQKRLLDAARSLLPEDGGLILRSAALDHAVDEIRREAEALRREWLEIRARSNGPAPVLLWEGDAPLSLLLREEAARLEYVLTNAPEALPGNIACPVKVCEHPFLLHNVPHRLERSLRRTVQMKSGATLVIDPCEAMTVIDVNSAAAIGGKNVEAAIEKINTEAAWEVARLLRLRGIGGMIVVDFIDMASAEARERLIATMREALGEDPVKTTVHGLTALGLMELTRRRAGTPLTPLDDALCPHCHGTGLQLTTEEEISDA
ncbi:MAG: ribonuclease E/G [Clostridia bacterium]|nr:ribonuclease E/G [Clostridia bacterium]